MNDAQQCHNNDYVHKFKLFYSHSPLSLSLSHALSEVRLSPSSSLLLASLFSPGNNYRSDSYHDGSPRGQHHSSDQYGDQYGGQGKGGGGVNPEEEQMAMTNIPSEQMARDSTDITVDGQQ